MSNSEDIAVLKERTEDHDRRITEAEQLASQTAANIGNLLVVSERHSEQIATLSKIVYGGLGIAVTVLVGDLMAHVGISIPH